jgi:hypothetical protein
MIPLPEEEVMELDKKKRIIRNSSIWRPLRLGVDHLMVSQSRKSLFKPVPLWRNSNIGNISNRNLTWPQASVRYPRMDPFGDVDKDGKLNMFDCRPFDKRRHSDPNLNFGFREDLPSKYPEKPEKSESEKAKIIKAVIYKRNWQEFHEGQRKGTIKKDESFPSWVEDKYEKKAEVEAKRISDIEKAKELGLIDEDS